MVTAPDGTEVFVCATAHAAGVGWRDDFIPTGEEPGRGAVTRIDHIGLAPPFERFDETSLFYRAVLGLEPIGSGEFAATYGLVRSRAVADPERRTGRPGGGAPLLGRPDN